MNYTPESMRTLAATLITIGSLAGGANAAAYYTFTEENGDVVLRSSGTLDVTQFSFLSDSILAASMHVSNGWIAPILPAPADRGNGVAVIKIDKPGFGWNIPAAAIAAGVIESGDTFVTVWSDGDPDTYIQSPETLDNNSFDSTIISPNLVVRWDGYTFNSMGMDLIAPDTDILIWKSNEMAREEGFIFLGISTIPEPSSSFLVALGGIWLAARRRRN